MKNLIFLFLLVASLPIYSQKIVQIFKWEAELVDGSLYIGIAETRNEALQFVETIIEELGEVDNHIIDYQIRYSPLNQIDDVTVFQEFEKYTSKGKDYVFLSVEEVETLKREKELGRKLALHYYQISFGYSEKRAIRHFNDEVLPIRKFMFLEKTNDSRDITMTMLNASRL